MTWTEDKLAILGGGLILLIASIAFYILPFRTFNSDIQRLSKDLGKLKAVEAPFVTTNSFLADLALESKKPPENLLGKALRMTEPKFQTWSWNPISAFSYSPKPKKKAEYDLLVQERELALKDARIKENLAKSSNYVDSRLNSEAKIEIEKWQAFATQAKSKKPKPAVSVGQTLISLTLLALLLTALLTFLIKLKGDEPVLPFMKAFLVLILLAYFINLISSQQQLKDMGLGYALWAIVFGIFISNVLGLPGWLKPALQHELIIKMGLVLLGSEILFGKILAIGLPGIFVAWFVTPIVLVATFWFGQNILKMTSKTLNITISADMSVCGVSAAIATAAACGAKKEELTTAIGLSMVFTSIMMVVMPLFINYVGMPEVLGGAWLGGTLDATGAVVAAGSFLGEKALSVAATIKMIQNILIGVVAFFVAYYWAAKVDKQHGVKVSTGEIWKRFPKFILGFIGASLIFSFLHELHDPLVSESLLENGALNYAKNIREMLFCLAFLSIGLSTHFKELKTQFSGGKPLLLYVVGQSFNLILTLLVAWIVFYKVFPQITANI